MGATQDVSVPLPPPSPPGSPGLASLSSVILTVLVRVTCQTHLTGEGTRAQKGHGAFSSQDERAGAGFSGPGPSWYFWKV